METIKIGDPMPKPCKNCDGMYGYQVTDKIRTEYTYQYEADGSMYGGFYSDFVNTSKRGIRAYCSNCGHDLKLKIENN